MSPKHNKLDEEVVNEVKDRLRDGESPEDIHEDDHMPSRRKVYDIKSDWEDAREHQKEMEREVFRDNADADRSKIIDVLEQAGVGMKQSGNPKADVERALNAIDFDSAWDDPHYVADTLVDEAGMTREWANRVVRKAYQAPDFPYVDQGEDAPASGTQRRRGRRQGGQHSPDARAERGQPAQQGQQPQQQQPAGGQADRRLRRDMRQLQNTVQQLAESVSDAMESDDDDGGMVRIERDDGSVIEVPANHPAAAEALSGGGDDDKDFMEKLSEAKEAGLIADPDDFGGDDDDDIMDVVGQLRDLGILDTSDGDESAEMMADMMDEMSEQFAEAQENVATQMSAAIAQLAEDDADDDDELTMDRLEDWWQQKQKEDELDTLQNELAEMREELKAERRQRPQQAQSPDQDPEVVKQRDKLNHEQSQLELVNDTLQELPEQLASAVREGALPVYKELNAEDGPLGNPFWSPPDGGQRGQPAYTPPRQRDPEPEHEPTPATAGGRSEAERSGYPDPDAAPATTADEPAPGDDAESEGGVSEERAQEVRAKLGIDDDGDAEEATN